MVRKCMIPNCRLQKDDLQCKALCFQKFPANENYKSKWIKALTEKFGHEEVTRMLKPKHMYVCDLHFNDEYFYVTANIDKLMLQKELIPTIVTNFNNIAQEPIEDKYKNIYQFIAPNSVNTSTEVDGNCSEFLDVSIQEQSQNYFNSLSMPEVEKLKEINTDELNLYSSRHLYLSNTLNQYDNSVPDEPNDGNTNSNEKYDLLKYNYNSMRLKNHSFLSKKYIIIFYSNRIKQESSQVKFPIGNVDLESIDYTKVDNIKRLLGKAQCQLLFRRKKLVRQQKEIKRLKMQNARQHCFKAKVKSMKSFTSHKKDETIRDMVHYSFL